jgi:two-component system response regulator HupR/HoxA
VDDHLGVVNDAGAYRVLLVEDDVMLRESLSILLADEFVVRSCGTGQQALELLRKEPPFDVVCTDYHMPGMSGVELFRAANSEHQPPHPHFVVLTGNSREVLECVPEPERATLSVLHKPCSPARIIDRIKQVAGATRDK